MSTLSMLATLVFAPSLPERDPSVLPCICGRCGTENLFFTCHKCGRRTPWCRGADDKYPDLCDDCAVEAGYCFCCGSSLNTLAPCPTCGAMLCQDCLSGFGGHICNTE